MYSRRALIRIRMQSSLDSFFGGKRAASTSKPAKIVKQEAENKDNNKNQPAVETKAEIKPEPIIQVKSKETLSAESNVLVPYSKLAKAFTAIEATTKRLEITKLCADLFNDVLNTSKADPTVLSETIYLCINKLGPDYEGLELGLGESLIMKALGESCGRQVSEIKKQYTKLGDLGQVAMASKQNQSVMFGKPKILTVPVVFDKLKDIAKSTGKESQQKKVNIIKGLLVQCQNEEAKYLVRSLEGKLRIGLAEKTVLIALSQTFVDYDKSIGRSIPADFDAEESIKDVFSQVPNYEIVIRTALESGIAQLNKNIKLTPGVPLKPMLAKPTKSVGEILSRFGEKQFTCEYKYDGERAQVHCCQGKMHVYSRNMEDMSQRYPDIIEILPKIAKPGIDYILDCEAVAWDREQQKILPFQVLSTRKRKDVLSGEIKVRIHLFAFDLLYYNGESFLTKPLSERRRVLSENFVQTPGQFGLAKSMVTADTEEIQQFLDKSISDSCEGLMIKAMDGPESKYEPSKRSLNWLKLKKDYLDGVGDTIDLVVVGAYYGKGKRTNVYGGFLLASYNQSSEEYETVCKIGTGFSDADLQNFYDLLSPLADSRKRSYVVHDESTTTNAPDVWIEPKHVWEVLTADLSLSPVYQAGKAEIPAGKGVSLRFPRFMRIREDKGPEDSTSSQQLVQMYYDQFQK